MKILLQKDTPKIGRAGEIVDVSDAHARNFILPKHFGRVATAADITQAASRVKKRVDQSAHRSERIRTDREKSASVTLPLKGHGNEQGKLFAALRIADVTAAAQQLGLDMTGCTCEPAHIKEIGVQELTIHWPDGAESTMKINVSNG